MIESAEEFLRLIRSQNPQDYDRSSHDEAPLEVWEEIIENYSLANQWIARNKTSPDQILEILAKDTNTLVRSEVAFVHRIPEPVQLILAKDTEPSVRNVLVNNPKATDTILNILTKDPERDIQKKAKERLNNQQSKRYD